MLFMSTAHVRAMNEVLGQSTELQALTAKLPREMSLTYELRDGPGGETVYWTLRTGPDGTAFGLSKPDWPPDVTIRVAWVEMIRAARAGRKGEHHPVELEVRGDESVLRSVEDVLAVARRVATFDCEFPATP